MFQLENNSFTFLNTKFREFSMEKITLLGWRVFGPTSDKKLRVWGNPHGEDRRYKRDFI